MSFLFPPTGSFSSPEELWTTAFHHLRQQIRQHFVRSEPHQQALIYLQGLMSGASRKMGGKSPRRWEKLLPMRCNTS
jgi:hypothetical protein